MCKYEYEKKSEKTNTVMIFCKLKNNDNEMLNICVSQKYCGKKNKYVSHNQEKNCKFYE